MTLDQLHLEVLKAMGWTHIDSAFRGVAPNEEDPTNWATCPPLTLDLMWQARRGLNPTERESYCEDLGDIALEKSPVLTDWELVDATAEQHARAYLSAKGIARAHNLLR